MHINTNICAARSLRCALLTLNNGPKSSKVRPWRGCGRGGAGTPTALLGLITDLRISRRRPFRLTANNNGAQSFGLSVLAKVMPPRLLVTSPFKRSLGFQVAGAKLLICIQKQVLSPTMTGTLQVWYGWFLDLPFSTHLCGVELHDSLRLQAARQELAISQSSPNMPHPRRHTIGTFSATQARRRHWYLTFNTPTSQQFDTLQALLTACLRA
jgi:hypothetical protein